MVGRANSLSNWSTTQYVVDPSGANGSYTTISAANTAAANAGGGQIFIRGAGTTYTESFTLGAGVSLNSYASIPNVFGIGVGATIDGTITLSNSGEGSINGISITNSSGGPCITATGSNGFLTFITNCVIVGGSAAAFQGTNGGANILIDSCDIVATSGDFLNTTGAQFSFTNCKFIGAGGTARIIQATGGSEFSYCNLGGPVTLSSGARSEFEYCDMVSITTADTAAFQCSFCNFQGSSPLLTTVGTNNNNLLQCVLTSGGGASINVGAGTSIRFDQGSIDSSGGSYAVTGTGAFQYGLLEMLGSTQTLDPGLTLSMLNVLPYATTSTRGVAYFNSGQFTVASDGEVSLTASTIPWTDETSTFNAAIANGYFILASLTAELPPNVDFPASLTNGNMIAFGVQGMGITAVIQAAAGQIIQIGSQLSSMGGTAVSTAEGDSLTLVFQESNQRWQATSVVGNWILS